MEAYQKAISHIKHRIRLSTHRDFNFYLKATIHLALPPHQSIRASLKHILNHMKHVPFNGLEASSFSRHAMAFHANNRLKRGIKSTDPLNTKYMGYK